MSLAGIFQLSGIHFRQLKLNHVLFFGVGKGISSLNRTEVFSTHSTLV
jgi:hypothetical protein